MFIGSLAIWPSKGSRVACVRPKSGTPYIYADIDSDGVFAESERYSLSPLSDRAFVKGAVVLYHELARGPIAKYPIRIAILKSGVTNAGVTPASSMEMVFAEGTVGIGGRQVPVTFMFDTDTGTVDPDYGWIGMDCNGDGAIDRGSSSPEWKFAQHQVVVFHVGDHYLSTQSVDVACRKIILRSHPAACQISQRHSQRVPESAAVGNSGHPSPDLPNS